MSYIGSEQAWIQGTSRKESRNTSVTKIYLVGFNYDDELLCKKLSQKVKEFWK